ncbi:MAG TPA: oligosaccharide flippase family protein [Terriglobales bacterium]|nr:oligosaccharide flippase family protein [Terriglobales bacterium]
MQRPPQQPRQLGTKIIWNTVSGALRILVVAPIPFLLTPFLVRRVGTAGFGIWAVLLSFNGLTALADLGIVGTLTKHVSEHYTRKDYQALNRVMNAGILMFSLIAAVCVLAVNLSTGLLISVFFRQSPLPVWQVEHAIRFLSIAIAFNLLAFPFNSVMSGLQRLDLTNLLWALNTMITALSAAVFVALGKGVPGLVDAIVLTSAIFFLINVLIAWRLLPELRIRPDRVRVPDIKALSAFSLKVYVVQVASTVYFHTEKLLLVHFTGPTPVGWYEIGNDLALKIRNAPALLMVPLMPAAAELEARGDDARTSQLYFRAHKYLAFTGIALLSVVAVLAHRFVDLWLGPGFTATARALIVLTGVHIGNLAGGPALLILVGRGNLKPAVRFALVGMLGTLILSTISISRWGFAGALYGTTVSILGSAAYLIWMFHQETGFSKRRLIRIYVQPILWGLFVVGLALYLMPIQQLHWVGLIGAAAAILTIYASGVLLSRYFDTFDLDVLQRFFPIPDGVRKSPLFRQ